MLKSIVTQREKIVWKDISKIFNSKLDENQKKCSKSISER